MKEEKEDLEKVLCDPSQFKHPISKNLMQLSLIAAALKVKIENCEPHEQLNLADEIQDVLYFAEKLKFYIR